MSNDASIDFDEATLNAMNAKAIENQFFTPDHVYIDLGLFKDLALGAVYSDFIRSGDAAGFADIQCKVLGVLKPYEARRYESVEAYLGRFGYGDAVIDAALADVSRHDAIFLLAPSGCFLNTLIRHTSRNQNHSRPANKVIKTRVNAQRKDLYTLQPIDITYHINTYPLTLSPHILQKMGEALGESLGVNIRFLNKDPALFDADDWTQWMEKIDCFYLDSIARFNDSAFTLHQQSEMQFAGCFIFARQRFARAVMHLIAADDYDHQVHFVTARQNFLSEFQWLTTTDVQLSPPPKRVEVLNLEEETS